MKCCNDICLYLIDAKKLSLFVANSSPADTKCSHEYFSFQIAMKFGSFCIYMFDASGDEFWKQNLLSFLNDMKMFNANLITLQMKYTKRDVNHKVYRS